MYVYFTKTNAYVLKNKQTHFNQFQFIILASIKQRSPSKKHSGFSKFHQAQGPLESIKWLAANHNSS